MRRIGRNARGGFTIIEILLSMIVLLLGIVGILILFPVGIQKIGESADDTMSAIIAESVQQALMRAMREPATGPNTRRIIAFHDGFPGAAVTFDLPPATQAGTPFYVTPAGLVTAAPGTVFNLGTDTVLANATQQIMSQTTGPNNARIDPTESYRQYSFSIDVMRLPNETLFEFNIHVYRNFSAFTGTIDLNTQIHPREKNYFRVQIGRVVSD